MAKQLFKHILGMINDLILHELCNDLYTYLKIQELIQWDVVVVQLIMKIAVSIT